MMKRILVIEDSPVIRSDICQLLRQNSDFSVFEASDAEEGIKFIEGGQSFDLLILDYHLPTMTGLDMLRQLAGRSKKVTCPVVMITSESEECGSEIKDLKIVCWIVKPINFQRFSIVINQIFSLISSGK